MKIFGASVIGPVHMRLGLPCQDAFAIARPSPGETVIAVADGLGSSAASDVGARVAVQAACAATGIQLPVGRDRVTALGEAARCRVVFARQALEERAESLGVPLRDVACTLIVGVLAEDNVAIAHIGDGAVVAETVDGLVLASPPADSEYCNEVVPLTAAAWEQSLRVTTTLMGVRSLGVFTDGCQRAGLRPSSQGLEPFAGFWNPVFQFGRDTVNVPEGETEFASLLASAKLARNSDDDKTLVIAVELAQSAQEPTR